MAVTSDNGRESALDRRRRTLQRARGAGDAATAAVAELDRQIDANATQGRSHEAALEAALIQVTALKKAIKASAREAVRLRAARKVARERALKAQQRSAAAERRYDDAMLTELVRRAKAEDLAAHAAPGSSADGTPARNTIAKKKAAPSDV